MILFGLNNSGKSSFARLVALVASMTAVTTWDGDDNWPTESRAYWSRVNKWLREKQNRNIQSEPLTAEETRKSNPLDDPLGLIATNPQDAIWKLHEELGDDEEHSSADENERRQLAFTLTPPWTTTRPTRAGTIGAEEWEFEKSDFTLTLEFTHPVLGGHRVVVGFAAPEMPQDSRPFFYPNKVRHEFAGPFMQGFVEASLLHSWQAFFALATDQYEQTLWYERDSHYMGGPALKACRFRFQFDHFDTRGLVEQAEADAFQQKRSYSDPYWGMWLDEGWMDFRKDPGKNGPLRDPLHQLVAGAFGEPGWSPDDEVYLPTTGEFEWVLTPFLVGTNGEFVSWSKPDIFENLARMVAVSDRQADDPLAATDEILRIVQDCRPINYLHRGKFGIPGNETPTPEVAGRLHRALSWLPMMCPRVLHSRVLRTPTTILNPSEQLVRTRKEDGTTDSLLQLSGKVSAEKLRENKLDPLIPPGGSVLNWTDLLKYVVARLHALRRANGGTTRSSESTPPFSFRDGEWEFLNYAPLAGTPYLRVRLAPDASEDAPPDEQLQFSDDDFGKRIFGVNEVGKGVIWALAQRVHALNHQRYYEHPEHFLHPKATADLVEELFDLTQFCMIETHSEAILLRMQKLVRDKKMKPSDVCILVFEKKNGLNSLHQVPLQENGDLTCPFPDGFSEIYWSER